MIETARKRIEDHPERYIDHIYGIHEAGGTSVLFLSDVPFDQLGFKHALADTTYPKLTWQALSQIPNIVSVGGVLMFGIWWIINRRIKLEDIENDQLSEEEALDKELNKSDSP